MSAPLLRIPSVPNQVSLWPERCPAFSASGHLFERQIPLSAGKNVITVIASTDTGNLTVERIITFSVGDKPSLKKINKYAVIIGIAKYKDTSIQALKYADKDAKEMYCFLTKNQNFPEENVKKLINEEATLKDWMRANAQLVDLETAEIRDAWDRQWKITDNPFSHALKLARDILKDWRIPSAQTATLKSILLPGWG